MKKLLRITVQDGENSYDEFMLINKKDDLSDIKDGYGGFMRAVKNFNHYNITEEEIKVLEKFGVI